MSTRNSWPLWPVVLFIIEVQKFILFYNITKDCKSEADFAELKYHQSFLYKRRSIWGRFISQETQTLVGYLLVVTLPLRKFPTFGNFWTLSSKIRDDNAKKPRDREKKSAQRTVAKILLNSLKFKIQTKCLKLLSKLISSNNFLRQFHQSRILNLQICALIFFNWLTEEKNLFWTNISFSFSTFQTEKKQ